VDSSLLARLRILSYATSGVVRRYTVRSTRVSNSGRSTSRWYLARLSARSPPAYHPSSIALSPLFIFSFRFSKKTCCTLCRLRSMTLCHGLGGEGWRVVHWMHLDRAEDGSIGPGMVGHVDLRHGQRHLHNPVISCPALHSAPLAPDTCIETSWQVFIWSPLRCRHENVIFAPTQTFYSQVCFR
jgi:hypothetical protein